VTEGRDRDCLSVDRVGLARLPRTAASTGHKTGRYTHYPKASREQIPLEQTGQMPTAFQREDDFRPAARPAHEFLVPVAGRRHRLVLTAAAHLVNRDHRVGPLMRVHADRDHTVPFSAVN